MTTTEQIIEAIVDNARPEILKKFRADSCIASTAIAIDILNYYGIYAEPLTVTTFIFNKPFVDRIKKGSNFPSGPTEVFEWAKQDGSYSLSVGLKQENVAQNKWNGHLVALVQKKFLIDLSLDQASRPKYNIILDPIYCEVTEEFLNGTPLIFEYNNCMLRMDRTFDNESYKASPDWMFKDRRSEVVKTIIGKIS